MLTDGMSRVEDSKSQKIIPRWKIGWLTLSPLSGPLPHEKWSTLATNRWQQRHSQSNSIGRLLARKAGYGGANCHCRGPFIPAASAVGGNCTAAATLQHANLAVANLTMENARAPRYLISGVPGLGLLLLSPPRSSLTGSFFSLLFHCPFKSCAVSRSAAV
ncbi:hypothetical protein CONLIGDRAFT_123655 [Coniochaeta ligniaria NRRL 30616]|uniref:Uncharacterized protein n=1 Tax=Coniochaeta ligniaria NRRL 30616 TaxID=1408157 RepID=A0A1J7J961_9PEZI|nr:hypothetical protein CONLIGDRAFT_123655 [Coniochaeta ligniaria NRRL 30616]